MTPPNRPYLSSRRAAVRDSLGLLLGLQGFAPSRSAARRISCALPAVMGGVPAARRENAGHERARTAEVAAPPGARLPVINDRARRLTTVRRRSSPAPSIFWRNPSIPRLCWRRCARPSMRIAARRRAALEAEGAKQRLSVLTARERPGDGTGREGLPQPRNRENARHQSAHRRSP